MLFWIVPKLISRNLVVMSALFRREEGRLLLVHRFRDDIILIISDITIIVIKLKLVLEVRTVAIINIREQIMRQALFLVHSGVFKIVRGHVLFGSM